VEALTVAVLETAIAGPPGDLQACARLALAFQCATVASTLLLAFWEGWR
jgi:hypothetical protein